MKQKITLFWFRRDLRLSDNTGLFHALKEHPSVLPLFIFDTNILSKLDNKKDPRVRFIHQSISSLKAALDQMGSSMIIKLGNPVDIFKELINQYDLQAVYTNRDYEPYAEKRDGDVHQLLKGNNIHFHTYKDHVLFERAEIVKEDGKPYTVFTPYSKKWKANINNDTFRNYDVQSLSGHFAAIQPLPDLSLSQIGFQADQTIFPDATVEAEILDNYAANRNYPGIKSTSRLGIHFRFGTVSIREYAKRASEQSPVFLNELIWRDFYQMIMWHFPYVVDRPFKKAYEFIQWRNNEEDFKKWCEGKTGYPIVDAGMRELNETGFMHNRVRMVTASFLTKHLLIDWQWGEAYFAEKLLDFDLASNNGGWQWAAGCGTDAAPYFRIFNPYIQTKNFDPDLKYIQRWVPETNSLNYPDPIVDHKFARQRALETYKSGLAKAKGNA